ncbi:hypothetical protein Bca52824_000895 [Brassica carinata]|uniref:Uncharacterized protein n=1 Tax=Brassica carinata TaxID=52824 RepID=A0A8X7WJ02_BRACI|nr:hypothetical protein Bca52824_000895 [Brassica carinata]
MADMNKVPKTLAQNNPLFGVLEEDQVGTDPLTGRPKIAKDVLEEMRRFLLSDTGEDLSIKIDKVKKSVREAENNPISQKTILKLESVPIITHVLDKGKGPVFDYGNKEVYHANWDLNVNLNKLMAASMKANRGSFPLRDPLSITFYGSLSDWPTVFRAGFLELCSFGAVRKKVNVRRRPPRAQRQNNQVAQGQNNQLVLVPAKGIQSSERREGKQEVGSRKQKKAEQGTEVFDLQVWLGYDSVFTVDPVGLSGGLALFWNKNIKNGSVLSRWKRKRNFNTKDKITLLQQSLEWFRSRDFPCRFMVESVRKELLHAYKEGDSFWRHKSRDKWLAFGDRSSKFFHGSVKTSRSRNHISKLKEKNNQDQWSDGAKAEVVVDYFTDLFKSPNPRPYDPASEKQVTKKIQEVFETGVMPMDWNLTYLCLYFNNGEFLNAPMGERPSYAWRSVMFGRELLQRGLRHRFGSGVNTCVWLDKWIVTWWKDSEHHGLKILLLILI